MPKSLWILQYRIGYMFWNTDLLKQAVTHDSMRWNNPNLPHYERLEHIGDAVIQMVITEYLFKFFPKAGEGFLTQGRSELVRSVKQASIANNLRLEEFIYFASGVQVYQFSRYDKFLEAIIGAVYIDAGGEGKGLDKCKEIIYKLWGLEDRLEFNFWNFIRALRAMIFILGIYIVFMQCRQCIVDAVDLNDNDDFEDEF